MINLIICICLLALCVVGVALNLLVDFCDWASRTTTKLNRKVSQWMDQLRRR